MELSAKQFEYALIMKFSQGRPSLHEIQLHIATRWKLSKEPVITLIDPRHVLIVPANHEDMVLAVMILILLQHQCSVCSDGREIFIILKRVPLFRYG